MTGRTIYDWATESDRRLYLVTPATLGLYVAAVAVASLGVVLAVTGRPAGLTLIAVALTVAAVAWGLHRAEETDG